MGGTKIVAGMDSSGSPRLEVTIKGKYKSIGAGAVVDTGFTGDVVIPEDKALSIGLDAGGAAAITLADGSASTVQLYLCKVKIGDIEQNAAAIVMGSDILIGMGLLSPFDVCFRSGTQEVIITPQPALADFVGVLHRLTEAT